MGRRRTYVGFAPESKKAIQIVTLLLDGLDPADQVDCLLEIAGEFHRLTKGILDGQRANFEVQKQTTLRLLEPLDMAKLAADLCGMPPKEEGSGAE